MNVTRNCLKTCKTPTLRNVAQSGPYAPGCGYAGAPSAPRIDDLPEVSKPADAAARSRIGIDEKSRDRSHAAAATAASGSVLRDLPESKGLPVVGTLFSFLLFGGTKRQHEYVDRRHKELGPIYRERMGPVTAVFVKSPHEYRRIFRLEGPAPKHFVPEAWVLYNEIRKCRRGLLFMDGDEWLRFRKILNKVMLVPDPTSSMAGPCQEVAEELVRKWRRQIERDAVIPDLYIQLYQWSIEAMLATLMGSSWHSCKQHLSKDVEKLAQTLQKIFEYSAQVYILPAKLAKNLRLPVWAKFVKSADTAFDIVRRLVPEMTRLGGDGLLRRMTDEGIRGEDAISIVADFVLAAGDTTATTLQWILFLLCNHPERQEELLRRVEHLSRNEVLRDPLLKGIIKESLRLYPTAPFLSRYLPEDSVIGNYFVPKGELLVLSIYSSGRDSANFSQANEFLPERWIRTEKGTYREALNPHASLPFAFGARSCIGRKLAETQISLALSELVKSFRIDCTNKDRVKLILHLISVPSEPMQLKLAERSRT